MALTKLQSSGDTSDIALNGVGYRLLNRKKQGQNVFSPRSAQGERDEVQDLDFWWAERIDDFSLGVGQKKVGDKKRFWSQLDLTLLDTGGLTLQKDGVFTTLNARNKLRLIYYQGVRYLYTAHPSTDTLAVFVNTTTWAASSVTHGLGTLMNHISIIILGYLQSYHAYSIRS